MPRELYDLLQERQIIHPTHIDHFSGSGNELRLQIRGFPWWRRDRQGVIEGELTLVFRGVGDSQIRLTDLFAYLDDEALEGFDISLVEQHDWARPREFCIYCSGPMTDPLQLHATVEDYLWNARSPRSTRDASQTAQSLANEYSRFLKQP